MTVEVSTGDKSGAGPKLKDRGVCCRLYGATKKWSCCCCICAWACRGIVPG